MIDPFDPVPGDEDVRPLHRLHGAVGVRPRAEARHGLGKPPDPAVDHLAIPSTVEATKKQGMQTRVDVHGGRADDQRNYTEPENEVGWPGE